MQSSQFLACFPIDQHIRLAYRRALAPLDHGLGHSVHVDREAHRRHGGVKPGQQVVVAAPQEHGVAPLLHIGAEHHAGIVVVALHQPQIHHHPVSKTQGSQGLIEAFQVLQGLPGFLPGAQGQSFVNDLRPAEKPGQAPHGPDGRAVLQPFQQRTQSGIVFGFNSAAQLLPLFLDNGELRRQGPEKARVADFHPETGQAALHGLDCQRHRFNVRPAASGSQQLHAGLHGLVTPAGKAGVVPINGLAVVEPHGLLHVLQPGSGQPGNGCGGIGPKHQEPALGVAHLIQHLLGDARTVGVKHIVELHPRGHRFLVTVGRKHLFQLLFCQTPGGAGFKEQIPRPLRRDFIIKLHPRFLASFCFALA